MYSEKCKTKAVKLTKSDVKKKRIKLSSPKMDSVYKSVKTGKTVSCL